jgi:hypothetical protein
MPIATSSQYAAMLDAASAGSYALAAVNVTSSETPNGAMRVRRGRRRRDRPGDDGRGGVPLRRRGGRHRARRPRARRVRARARRALSGGDRAAHRPCAARQVRRVRAAAHRRIAPARRARRAATVSVAHVRRLDRSARGEPAALGRAARRARAARRRARARGRVVGGEEDGVAGPPANRDELRSPRRSGRSTLDLLVRQPLGPLAEHPLRTEWVSYAATGPNRCAMLPVVVVRRRASSSQSARRSASSAAPRAPGRGQLPSRAPTCGGRPRAPACGGASRRISCVTHIRSRWPMGGGALIVIQRQLGHSNLGITSIYRRAKASTTPRSSMPSTPATRP